MGLLVSVHPPKMTSFRVAKYCEHQLMHARSDYAAPYNRVMMDSDSGPQARQDFQIHVYLNGLQNGQNSVGHPVSQSFASSTLP